MGYLIGATKTPPSNYATYSVWEAENSIMMVRLINQWIRKERIGCLYLFYKSIKEVWDVVEEMYLDFEDISQSFKIRSKI